jgi:hypothetical protein
MKTLIITILFLYLASDLSSQTNLMNDVSLFLIEKFSDDIEDCISDSLITINFPIEIDDMELDDLGWVFPVVTDKGRIGIIITMRIRNKYDTGVRISYTLDMINNPYHYFGSFFVCTRSDELEFEEFSRNCSIE